MEGRSSFCFDYLSSTAHSGGGSCGHVSCRDPGARESGTSCLHDRRRVRLGVTMLVVLLVSGTGASPTQSAPRATSCVLCRRVLEEQSPRGKIHRSELGLPTNAFS